MVRGAFLCFVVAFATGLRLSPLPRTLLSRLQATTIRSDAETTAWGVQSWRDGFATIQKENVQILDGALPADLEGTYFRNGFGKFEIGKTSRQEGLKILHPFDADGLVAAVTMKDGKGTYRHSFVRTKGFKKESKTREMSGRGTFGNHKPRGLFGNFLSIGLKNVANTNIMYWGDRLLALWEGGLPYKLEPDSLRTTAEYTFKGLLKKGDTFTAHPRVDANTNRLVGFSSKRDTPKESSITVYEFDQGLNPVSQRTFTVPGTAFFHDFVVTKNYYVFNAPPLKFDPLPFALGLKAPAQCLEYVTGQPSMLYLVPRDRSPIMKIAVDPHFNFHFANAYEDDKSGELIFDVVWADRMELGVAGSDTVPIWDTVDFGKEVPFSTLKRYTLTPTSEKDENGQPKWSHKSNKLSSKGMDFTSVNPQVSCKKHRYIYASYGRDPTQASPPQGLIKLDVESGTEQTWIGEPDEFLGEAIFAPRKNTPAGAAEDDGYVLSYLSDWTKNKSEFVVFDAKDIAKGPVYRCPLAVPLPHGLHGTYADGLTFEQDDIVSRWKACNALDSKVGWNEVNSGFSGLGISYDL